MDFTLSRDVFFKVLGSIVQFYAFNFTQNYPFRVLEELVVLRDDFERQKRDMESFFRNQLQSFQQKQGRDIQMHIQKGKLLQLLFFTHVC